MLLVLFFSCVSCSLCITIFFIFLCFITPMFCCSYVLLLMCFTTLTCSFYLITLVFQYSYMLLLPHCSYALELLCFDGFVCFAMTWCFITLVIHCSYVLWYDIMFHYSCVSLFLRTLMWHGVLLFLCFALLPCFAWNQVPGTLLFLVVSLHHCALLLHCPNWY